ncbi:MAG: DUF1499 domain-containing protein [Pseudomonadota bacterium]
MGLIVESWVRNRWTLWASRIALFAIQLAAVAFVLHRTQAVGTPLGLGLFTVAGALAVLGGLAAFVGFVQLWQNGGRGGLRGAFAVLVMIVALAPIAFYLPTAIALPLLNDVSTDLGDPPDFLARPSAGASPSLLAAADGDGMDPAAQQQAYPDIAPLIISRPLSDAFDAARAIATREGFDIVAEQPPQANDGAAGEGVIHAVDETVVMGFRDDVVFRVASVGGRTRVDLRSASRYGQHDFGRNAQRIRRLRRLLRARLDFELPAEESDTAETTPAAKPAPKRVKRKKKLRPAQQVRRKRRRRARSGARRAPRPITPRQE